ncbi:DUF1461 domain-containing protein [Candidatus Woesearchaeota archaeon]|nr:DUF1461 domain-containing protein [Candidatus Woesearchaeota archaeon]
MERQKLLCGAVLGLTAVALSLSIFLGVVVFFISNDSYILSLAASTSTPESYWGSGELDSATSTEVSKAVLEYVRGDSPALQRASFFREEELVHLAEVRRLISRIHLAFNLAISAFAAAFFALFVISGDLGRFREYAKVFLLLSGWIILALAGFAALSWLNFDASFTVFHRLLFTDSLWEFPSNHALVSLFTEAFFAKLAFNIVLGSVLGGAVLFGLGVNLPGGRK